MKLKTKLIIATTIALFFIGFSMILLTTEDIHKENFFKITIHSLGLLICNSIGIGIIVRFFIGGLFDTDIASLIKKEHNDFVFSEKIRTFGIRNIIFRRTEIPIFKEIINKLPQSKNENVEVFVCGVSLSLVIPHHCDEILKLSKEFGFKFRFLMMCPENPHKKAFGMEIKESGFPKQIQSQFEQLKSMLSKSKEDNSHIQGRTYSTIPFNSIFYCKISEEDKSLFLVDYLNSVPGSSCPVIEFQQNHITDPTLFNHILDCYEKMWANSNDI